MDIQKISLAVVAIAMAVLAFAGLTDEPVVVQVSDGEVRVVETGPSVGAVPGPDVYNHMYFNAGLTQGGRVVATSSSAAAGTLVASDLFNSTTGEATTRLEVTPTGAAYTLTLPASSTLSSLAPNNGDTVTFVVENEATAATTTTIAAGSGMDLQEPDGQNVVIGQNNFAFITMQRDENGDFIVLVDETIPAD